MRTSAELDVDHPPEAVWSYFADVARWPEWSPVCAAARLHGDRLAMTLRLAGIRLPVKSRIVAREAPRRLAWHTRWPGYGITHEDRFEARRGGTRIINEERFDGLPAPVGALVRRYYVRRTPLETSLRALRGGLERALR